jgi:hypothetical protein
LRHALVAIVLLSACSGSHGGGTTIVPATVRDAARAADAVAPANADALDINAGGGAAGAFVADRDFVARGTWTYGVSHVIDTSGVTNPAPQAVYQNDRNGSVVTYTVPGLTAGAAYTVQLDFAELFWTRPGQRVFDISIDNAQVLANFDIIKAAGSPFKAVAESFAATASAAGTITVTLTATVNYAAIAGVEVAAGGATPKPVSFNDYPTFAYDDAHDAFNPNSTAFTPSSLAKVRVAWKTALGGDDYNTQTQPVLGTNIAGHRGVLYVGGGSGTVYGYDALTGALLWKRATGQLAYTCPGAPGLLFGVGGTAAYDPASRSLYVMGNVNAAPNAVAKNILYHLDAASGAVLGQVNVAPPVHGWSTLDFAHTAVTLSDGVAYVGTGSTCDISPWRGRVAAVDVPAMQLAATFSPVWKGTSQPWSGGGIWGWGGVSIDAAGNVLTGVGNTDNGTNGGLAPPFAPAPFEYSGLGEALVKLSPRLSAVIDSNHPIPTGGYGGMSVDLDVQGTPALFTPNGPSCAPMAALQSKAGSISFYIESQIGAGPVAQFALAPSSYQDSFIGGPGVSPATGLVYAPVPSSSGSLFAPGLAAIDPGCGLPSVLWHSAFGPDSGASGIPRSVPAASAGGVVFAGTPCVLNGNGGCMATALLAARRGARGAADTLHGALWALDASTGTVLNGGKPLLITSGPLRMPVTIDGDWLFVLDNNGTMYGLTL